MSDIKVGDVVEIKSGGPRMVVVSILPDSGDPARVCAQWFEESAGEFREEHLSLSVLKKHGD